MRLDYNNSRENEKAMLSHKGIHHFFEQFGNDEHAKILLEVLLEGLFNEEAVFVLGEQEQKRDQTDHHSKG